ncbi:hypothetical protein FSP39_025291 [Pinctada imbricata]|uniref:Antistasin-like domain-containing protein n=1 Tax=Pinctada imbricata TaxID=66713 RepID=A0AA89BTR2_PINIB|nr:hypothetical protein FSP39_025291 [Pinctada imbricata]
MLVASFYFFVFCFFSNCLPLYVSSAPNKRGSCLSLCGHYGVSCPQGYECRSNGCGHECYRPKGYTAPEHCTKLECDYHCPLGYKTDDRGCDICKCDYSAMVSLI